MKPRPEIKRTKGGAVHPSVARGLRKLGADISLARRGRKLTSEEMAGRMGVTRGTLRRLEQGDPGVAINTLAMALSALGMLDRLTDLVDQATDDIGLMSAREAIGERVRRPRSKPSKDAQSDLTPLPRSKSSNIEPEGW